MKKAFLLFLFVITNVVSFAQWNNWTDANSVKRNLLLAQSKGKTYFSQYHLYNVREKDIWTPLRVQKTTWANGVWTAYVHAKAHVQVTGKTL